MRIDLHIDRLILEGLPAAELEEPKLRAAIQAELIRLLKAQGLSNELKRGVAVPGIKGGTVDRRGGNAGGLGQSVARAIHAGIGGSTKLSKGASQ
jgi:hypothetical protein